MGADIYLKSIYNEGREAKELLFKQAADKRDRLDKLYGRNDSRTVAAQKEVNETYEALFANGYFRDSYNSTSLFWLLGLSWWQLGDELLDEDRNLPIENAKVLLARLESTPVTDENFANWEKARREDGWKFEDNSPAEWRKSFEEKHADLCNLLRASIQYGEPLFWSV